MKRPSSGFALPTILLIVTVLLIVGLALIQSASSIRTSVEDQYYTRLAKETAEAGITAANYCLQTNNFIQTWGPDASNPNLSQNTDCDGDTLSPQVSSLHSGGITRATFSVGDLEVRDDGAIIIVSTGTVDVLRSTGGAVARTYTSTLKQLVNWKQFEASVSASGTNKTCAVITSELYCWGANSVSGGEDFSGQLGDGTFTDSLTPVKVMQDTGLLAGKIIDAVFSAQYHSCALAAGKVYCWGQNNSGQLGNGTFTDSNVPVEVGGALSGKIVSDIGGTGDTSCAIAEGKIYCWGENGHGTVGDNSTTDRNTPTAVNTSSLGASYTATKLSTSGSRSFNMCAIANNGKAYCWGDNDAGQVGNGTSGSTDVRVPTKVYDGGVLSGKTVTAISQDGYYTGSPAWPHVCVVASGKVYCWGENNAGQLGRGNTSDSNVPVAVVGTLSSKVVQDVVVGLQHSCALANSRVYCWGDNGAGQLGDDKMGIDRSTPALVSELPGGLQGKTVTAIGGGANRGCAIADYRAYCWGLNNNGQLGDGTQTNRDIPTEAIFLRPQAPAYIF